MGKATGPLSLGEAKEGSRVTEDASLFEGNLSRTRRYLGVRWRLRAERVSVTDYGQQDVVGFYLPSARELRRTG